MPGATDKIMQLVQRELKKNPKATTKELYAKAKKANRSVSRLNIRQFHAKYPLQVKRKMAPRKPRKTRAKRTVAAPRGAPVPETRRQAVRAILLEFAKNLAVAESQAETIDLVRNLDKYVDRIVKAAG